MALNGKTALSLTLLVPTVVFGAQTWRSASTSIAITDVTPIDRTGTSSQPHMSVAIADGRITDIAPTARFKQPAGAQIVDASGKFAIPDLQNMQVHSVSYEQAKAALPAVLTAAADRRIRAGSGFVPRFSQDRGAKFSRTYWR